ncbi:MAG: TauD/TfdA family dioxygenase [Rhodospirillales bacterium]
MSASAFATRKLSDAIGVEVTGVDFADPSEADFAALYAAWLDGQVLLARGQTLSDADLVAFSRRFGELDIAPPNENGQRHAGGFPEVFVVSNVIEKGEAIGSLGAGESVWHTDMNYLPAPPMASMLYCLETPAAGGKTGFMNMYAAFDALPDGLRRRVEGLQIKHDSTTNSAGYRRLGAAEVSDVTTSPGQLHPIVRQHPETGRPALYLGRRLHAWIAGLPLAESEALLDELWAHAAKDEFTWHHSWRPGDILIWDNRCTMHRRDPFDPDSRRIMHRTQIRARAGEPFSAPVESAA